MNRSLWIPAVCCFAAFAALFAVLSGVAGREKTAAYGQALSIASAVRDKPTLALVRSASKAPSAESLVSVEETEQMLTALTGEYLRPWRQWESSPSRLYSRVAPRPIPTIYAGIEISPQTSPSESFLVATITVTKGGESEAMPCVVDRLTRQTRLFADGRWLTEAEWLEQAPLP